MTTVIIEKEGKQVMELAQDVDVCSIVKRYVNGVVHIVISDEEFAYILDRADENGCDIFCYYD